MDIFQSLKKYKTISIIGMEKNAGKTTVLNRIIKECKGKLTLALTTIGRDGEEKDLVTATKKPRIYIYAGTIIATAKDTLKDCDITKEILLVTDYSTPMGNIVILRAKSDGYVDIAGPSYNSQIKKICEIMNLFGSELTIVDGALSRKQSATTNISDGTILVTGAALNSNIDTVVEETAKCVDFLLLPQCSDKNTMELSSKLGEASGIFIYEDSSVDVINELFFLENSELVKEKLQKGISKIIMGGACTDKSLSLFIENRNRFKSLEIVVRDGTKFFLSNNVLKRAKLSKITFSVIDSIDLLFLAYNPTSPFGYSFNKEEFHKKLKDKIRCNVIDVLEE